MKATWSQKFNAMPDHDHREGPEDGCQCYEWDDLCEDCGINLKAENSSLCLDCCWRLKHY